MIQHILRNKKYLQVIFTHLKLSQVNFICFYLNRGVTMPLQPQVQVQGRKLLKSTTIQLLARVCTAL